MARTKQTAAINKKAGSLRQKSQVPRAELDSVAPRGTTHRIPFGPRGTQWSHGFTLAKNLDTNVFAPQADVDQALRVSLPV